MAVQQDYWNGKKDEAAIEWLRSLKVGDKFLHPPPTQYWNECKADGSYFEAVTIVSIHHDDPCGAHMVVRFPNRGPMWDKRLPFKYAFAGLSTFCDPCDTIRCHFQYNFICTNPPTVRPKIEQHTNDEMKQIKEQIRPDAPTNRVRESLKISVRREKRSRTTPTADDVSESNRPSKRIRTQMEHELNHDERYDILLKKWEAEKLQNVELGKQLTQVGGEKDIAEQNLANMKRQYHDIREENRDLRAERDEIAKQRDEYKKEWNKCKGKLNGILKKVKEWKELAERAVQDNAE